MDPAKAADLLTALELNDLLRRAGSIAIAVPRQISELVNAGSIENAREEVRVAGIRRKLNSALEKAERLNGSGSSSNPQDPTTVSRPSPSLHISHEDG